VSSVRSAEVEPAAAAKAYPKRKAIYVDPPHPSALDEATLLKQCTIGFGRSAGPGGQHRNKVETAVSLVHDPTGVRANATERRSQIDNRRVAIKRLRLKLARDVRTPVSKSSFKTSSLWDSRRQGKQLSINPTHHDYPALLAEALDVVMAKKFDVAGSAGVLGITMSQLARLIRHDRHAFATVNEGRTQRGLPALK
jgi:hypothetical protein